MKPIILLKYIIKELWKIGCTAIFFVLYKYLDPIYAFTYLTYLVLGHLIDFDDQIDFIKNDYTKMRRSLWTNTLFKRKGF